MRYFDGCVTNADVKARFRELCKKLHPDCGGNAADFIRMQKEYEEAFERCKNVNRAEDGSTYTQETAETAGEYMRAYESIMHCSGLVIELCGTWLWVSGDTRTHKDALKAAGFRWHSKKLMWYWAPNDGKSHHARRNVSMSEIYGKYGRDRLKTESRESIA